MRISVGRFYVTSINRIKMSRIGKAPISLPEGVTLAIDKNVVSVKGPKGELRQEINPDMECKLEDGVFTIARPTEQKRHKAMHGLYRSLVSNMVEGVNSGYKKDMELVGVGYKASVQNNVLELNLGYSHSIYLAAVLPAFLLFCSPTKRIPFPL